MGKTFIDKCIVGQERLDAIDSYVEAWHGSDTSQEIHDFLGMTKEEYFAWVQNPQALAGIVNISRSRLKKQCRVGVGAIVEKNGKVLLGKRLGSHGAGTWSFPGGHVEYRESFEVCAAREVLEETGIVIPASNFRRVIFTNDLFPTSHYVTLFLRAETGQEPQNMEPHKCEGWLWFDWDKLPRPLFLPIDDLIKDGYLP